MWVPFNFVALIWTLLEGPQAVNSDAIAIPKRAISQTHLSTPILISTQIDTQHTYAPNNYEHRCDANLAPFPTNDIKTTIIAQSINTPVPLIIKKPFIENTCPVQISHPASVDVITQRNHVTHPSRTVSQIVTINSGASSQRACIENKCYAAQPVKTLSQVIKIPAIATNPRKSSPTCETYLSAPVKTVSRVINSPPIALCASNLNLGVSQHVLPSKKTYVSLATKSVSPGISVTTVPLCPSYCNAAEPKNVNNIGVSHGIKTISPSINGHSVAICSNANPITTEALPVEKYYQYVSQEIKPQIRLTNIPPVPISNIGASSPSVCNENTDASEPVENPSPSMHIPVGLTVCKHSPHCPMSESTLMRLRPVPGETPNLVVKGTKNDYNSITTAAHQQISYPNLNYCCQNEVPCDTRLISNSGPLLPNYQLEHGNFSPTDNNISPYGVPLVDHMVNIVSVPTIYDYPNQNNLSLLKSLPEVACNVARADTSEDRKGYASNLASSCLQTNPGLSKIVYETGAPQNTKIISTIIPKSVMSSLITLEAQRIAEIERNADVEKNVELEKNAQIARNAQLERIAQFERNAQLERIAQFERNSQLEKMVQIERNIQLERIAQIEKNAQRDRIAQIERNAQLEKNAEIERNAQLEKNALIERNAQLEKNAQIERNIQLERIAQIERNAQRNRIAQIERKARLEKNAQIERDFLNELPAPPISSSKPIYNFSGGKTPLNAPLRVPLTSSPAYISNSVPTYNLPSKTISAHSTPISASRPSLDPNTVNYRSPIRPKPIKYESPPCNTPKFPPPKTLFNLPVSEPTNSLNLSPPALPVSPLLTGPFSTSSSGFHFGLSSMSPCSLPDINLPPIVRMPVIMLDPEPESDPVEDLLQIMVCKEILNAEQDLEVLTPIIEMLCD